MALYFLFQNEDGTVGFDVSNIDERISASNSGVGPYDFPPTEEMLEEVRRSGLVLPHRVDFVVIGLLPPSQEEKMRILAKELRGAEFDLLVENARGDFRILFIAICVTVVSGLAVVVILKGLWTPAFFDAFLTTIILGFCASVYCFFNPQ